MRFLIAAFLILAFTAPALAQQKPVYVKPATPQQQEQAPAGNFPWVTPPDPNEPALDASIGERYYYTCMKERSTIITESGQEAMCSCASAKIGTVLTPEEFDILEERTLEGQAARDKLLIQVHTVCLQYPAYDLVYSRCMADTTYQAELSRHAPVCQCAASSIAQALSESSASYYSTSMRIYPSSKSPIESMIDTPGFEMQVKYYVADCLRKEEMGTR